jgi:FixJ family two-component response regulator
LFVDEDMGTCETMEIALPEFGFQVVTAHTASAAVSLATQQRIDCLLVDQRLPDMMGVDLVRTIRSRGVDAPFAMMSGLPTVPVIVEAMRLGAHDVLEKPIDIDQVASVVSALVGMTVAAEHSETTATSGSIADRWADYAEKACACNSDPKTLEQWARAAGVSYSSLCETCRLLSMQPHAARDFVRVLRVLILARRLQCPPEALLDVSDRRTLSALFRRAGIEHKAPAAAYSVSMFLQRQRFIEPRNQALDRLTARLEKTAGHPMLAAKSVAARQLSR